MSLLIALLTSAAGVAVSWAITVPVHRYKELRPLTPRDVAAEASPDGPAAGRVRAAYRQARCPHCHRTCTWRDVAPLTSWARGCPGCGTALPGTVPLLQVGLPVALLVTVVALPGTWLAVPYLFLTVALIAMATVDLRIWLIPFWMPWAAAAIGLALIAVASVGRGDPRQIVVAVVGGLGAFAAFFVLFALAPGKLGFGDVRLALVLGLFLAWLDPLLVVYGLLFGAVLGVLMGAAALLTRGDSRFPFGPALSLGAMAAVWLHEPILRSVG